MCGFGALIRAVRVAVKQSASVTSLFACARLILNSPSQVHPAWHPSLHGSWTMCHNKNYCPGIE